MCFLDVLATVVVVGERKKSKKKGLALDELSPFSI